MIEDNKELKVGDMVYVSDVIEKPTKEKGVLVLVAILSEQYEHRYICELESRKGYAQPWKYASPIQDKPVCGNCGGELGETACSAKYAQAGYCSTKCADIADLRELMKEL